MIERFAVPLAVFWVTCGVASIVLLLQTLRSGTRMPRIFGPLIASVVLVEGVVQSEGLSKSGLIVQLGSVFGIVTTILVGVVFFVLSFYGGTPPVALKSRRQLFEGKCLFFWFLMVFSDLLVVVGLIAFPSMTGWVLVGVGGLLFVVSAIGQLRAIRAQRWAPTG